MYTINTYDISFSLYAVENIKFCDRIITKTEHPKLFIYEKTNVNVLFDNDVRQQQDLINIDIFGYTNAKFVHVEKHFRAKRFKSNKMKKTAPRVRASPSRPCVRHI